MLRKLAVTAALTSGALVVQATAAFAGVAWK